MLSKQTCQLICDFLIVFARSEKKLEVTRQLLAEELEFEPYAAFKRVDRNINQIITCQEIRSYLQDNGLNYSLDAINKSYIAHYDIDQDQGLVFSELKILLVNLSYRFLRSILPFDNPNLRSVCTQRPTYDVPRTSLLHPDVECIMSRLLENEICAYLELEPFKQNIAQQIDFSIEKCFAQIDTDNNGYLDFENLMNFFSMNNYFPYEEEIISILRRLDKDDDGRLSLNDLASGILPKFFSPSDIQRASLAPMDKKLTSQSNKFDTPSKKLPGSILSSGSKLQGMPGQIISPSRNKYPFEPVRKASPTRQIPSPQKNFSNITETVNLNRSSPQSDFKQRILNLDSQMNKQQQQSQAYNYTSGNIYSPSGRMVASPVTKYTPSYY